jgi:hypothetical protein
MSYIVNLQNAIIFHDNTLYGISCVPWLPLRVLHDGSIISIILKVKAYKTIIYLLICMSVLASYFTLR